MGAALICNKADRKRVSTILRLFFVLLLLSLVIGKLFSIEIYTRRVVTPAGNTPIIKDFLVNPGLLINDSDNAESGNNTSILEKKVTGLPRSPAVIPASIIQPKLFDMLNQNNSIVFIGGDIIFIPHGTEKQRKIIYTHVLRFLNNQMDSDKKKQYVLSHIDTKIPDWVREGQDLMVSSYNPFTDVIEKGTGKIVLRVEPAADKNDITNHSFRLSGMVQAVDDANGRRNDNRKRSGNNAFSSFTSKGTIDNGSIEKNNSRPDLVRSGDSITVIINRGGISLRMAGRSLASGKKGETVRVSITSTGKRFEGLVSGEKEVRLEI